MPYTREDLPKLVRSLQSQLGGGNRAKEEFANPIRDILKSLASEEEKIFLKLKDEATETYKSILSSYKDTEEVRKNIERGYKNIRKELADFGNLTIPQLREFTERRENGTIPEPDNDVGKAQLDTLEHLANELKTLDKMNENLEGIKEGLSTELGAKLERLFEGVKRQISETAKEKPVDFHDILGKEFKELTDSQKDYFRWLTEVQKKALDDQKKKEEKTPEQKKKDDLKDSSLDLLKRLGRHIGIQPPAGSYLESALDLGRKGYDYLFGKKKPPLPEVETPEEHLRNQQKLQQAEADKGLVPQPHPENVSPPPLEDVEDLIARSPNMTEENKAKARAIAKPREITVPELDAQKKAQEAAAELGKQDFDVPVGPEKKPYHPPELRHLTGNEGLTPEERAALRQDMSGLKFPKLNPEELAKLRRGTAGLEELVPGEAQANFNAKYPSPPNPFEVEHPARMAPPPEPPIPTPGGGDAGIPVIPPGIGAGGAAEEGGGAASLAGGAAEVVGSEEAAGPPGWVLIAVEAIVAAGIAFITLPKVIEGFDESLQESQKHLEKFNATIAVAIATAEVEDIKRNIRIGRETEGTTKVLTESFSQLKDSLEPQKEGITNFTNGIGALAANVGSILAYLTGPMFEWLGTIGKFVAFLSMKFDEAVVGLKNDPFWGRLGKTLDVFSDTREKFNAWLDKELKKDAQGTVAFSNLINAAAHLGPRDKGLRPPRPLGLPGY